ncbi:MAG: NAD(P)-dependent oxidoreductase [Desulfurococcales archaeon]|nr:NAD(P)-dependent oxidoreductase [Desulfurococcales archaeon]
MRVVLVGGLGFLGAALSERLAGQGWRVVVAARRSSAQRRPRLASYLRGLGVELALAPGGIDAGFLEGLGGDVYYHLAGRIRGSRGMWEAHARLAAVVVEAASRLGSRVVYVSSVRTPGRILGAGRCSRVVEEEPHLDHARVRPETPYERSKAEGERIVASYRGPWAILRPGLLVGRWGYHTEWRLTALASKLRLAPSLPCVPVTPVSGLASMLAGAGEGRYDGLWVNALACTCDLSRVTLEACKRLTGGGCRRIPVAPLLGLAGRLSSEATPPRELWVMARRGYRYESRHPQPPWPSPEEAAAEWASWLKWWGSLSL